MYQLGTTFEGRSESARWADIRLLKELDLSFTSCVEAVAEYTNVDPPVSYAIEFQADALLEQGKKDEAAELYTELAEKHDRIRAAYWDWRRSSL